MTRIPTAAGPARVLVLACLFTLCAFAGPVAGQEHDEEGELDRVKRDQARVSARLESLREKMERLAARYEDEGRERNAELLRDAMEHFDESALLDLSRDVARSLDLGNLGTVEKQDDLVGSLESILSVLRDRRDVEELQRHADLAREGLKQLGFLAENQRRLLAETRALSDRPAELLDEALETAKTLSEQAEATDDALSTLQDTESQLGLADLAGELAAAQRALAGSASPTADAQAALEAALSVLREQLQSPLSGASEELIQAAEEARAMARGASADAAAAMAEARERLEREARAARGESGSEAGAGENTEPSVSEGAGPQGSESTGARPGQPTEGGDDASGGQQTGDASEPEASSGESAPAESDAGNPPGQPSGQQPSEPSPASGSTPSESESSPSGQSRSGESPAGESPAGESPAGESQAGESQAGESQAGESPSDEADEPRPQESAQGTDARAAMDESADLLDEVRDALERSERSLAAARNRARAMASAASRDAAAAAEDLEDLAQRLEAIEPEEGPELLDRTRALLAQARERESAVAAGQMDAASQQAMDLKALMEMLQQRSELASAEAQAEATPEQLAELADRQDGLREQTRELMDRLAELPDQTFSEAMERASKAQSQASASLRSGESSDAATREEEAAEELERAQDELAGDQEQYEQLRQDEVLFRLGEELRSLQERQLEVGVETSEIDDSRADRDRLGRSEKRAVARLAVTERDLSAEAENLRKALSEDGAVSFVYSLASVRDDLVRAAELLGEQDTGYIVQAVQEDVGAALTDLLATLDEELERRQNAETEPQQQQQQQPGQQPLVPPVAELLLLRRMELRQLARLEAFVDRNPQIKDEALYGDIERELLDRWSLEHGRVSSMLEEILPTPAEPEPELPVDGRRPGAGPEEDGR